MVESKSQAVLPKFVRLTVYTYLSTLDLLTLVCFLNKAERKMIPESAIACANRGIDLWRLDVAKMNYLLSMVERLSLSFVPRQICQDTKEFYQYIQHFALNISLLPDRFRQLNVSLQHVTTEWSAIMNRPEQVINAIINTKIDKGFYKNLPNDCFYKIVDCGGVCITQQKDAAGIHALLGNAQTLIIKAASFQDQHTVVPVYKAETLDVSFAIISVLKSVRFPNLKRIFVRSWTDRRHGDLPIQV